MDISSAETMVNAFDDPVFIIGQNREIVKANQSARETFGDDLEGLDLARAFRHPTALGHVDQVLMEASNAVPGVKPKFVEFQLASDVPTDFRLSTSFAFLNSSGAAYYLVILKDVSHILEAEQMRSDFVANVSHELRSPLTAISGFIETLLGAASNDETARKRFLVIMEREANRMNRIIDDLLTLSKVELDARVRPTSNADLKSVVTKVVNTLEQQAVSQNKKIAVQPASFDCIVNGDEDQLVQVVQNLVDNALKYGDANTEITVSLAHHEKIAGLRGSAISFCVADEGDGIAPEHLSRLTERFYRVDGGRSREKGGTGLGLAIVKHIVNRHRGKLTIESKKTAGSKFTVYLPVAVRAYT